MSDEHIQPIEHPNAVPLDMFLSTEELQWFGSWNSYFKYRFDKLDSQFSSLTQKVNAMSAQLDSIKAALAGLVTTVTTGLTTIDGLLAKLPTAADDQETADIVNQIQATSTALQAELAKVPTP